MPSTDKDGSGSSGWLWEMYMEEPVDEKQDWNVLYHFYLFDGSHKDKLS